MRDHLEHRALHALLRHAEEAHGDEAHMRHRGIGDQLLHVLLHQRDQRGVDDRDDREREDERREIGGCVREHRQREADEAVTAHLQKNAGQDDRARGRRLDMRVGQPGMHRPHRHLDRERGEEGEEQPFLHRRREGGLQKHRDVGGSGDAIHRHDGEQHQQRADQRVEEEFEAGVDAPLAAPDADDEEHRNEAALEEEIEQHEIERGKDAEHQRLEHEEGDHIILHPVGDRFPRGGDAERHQEGGEQQEGDRHAVDAHLVDEARAEPALLLDELERRRRCVEPAVGDERQREDDQGRRQRREAGVVEGRFVLAAQREDKGRADERQENDAGENAEAEHQCAPPTRYQVMSAARPISMAKA